MKLPDIEKLRETLDYNPDTGEFHWKVNISPRFHAGARAGTQRKDGYWFIKIWKTKHCAHRLAFAITYGVWPSLMIDHINRNPSDNRINNLREVTVAQNGWNSGIRKNNSTGYKGVSYSPNGKQFVAKIRNNSKQVTLGYFETAKEAAAAYQLAAKQFHGPFYNLCEA